ncbi:hypothetical protein ACFL0H_15135 [Thermodesulfobacteriota bacterium]
MKINKHAKKWLAFLSIIFPPLVTLFFIGHYSINLPYMDHWDGFLNILTALKEGSLDFSHLWAQHNEHRLIFPKIIMILLAKLSHWNVLWEQYFSFFMNVGTLFLIFELSKGFFRSDRSSLYLLFRVSSSILLFSMVQYENWAWGWQIQIFLNIFAVCFTIWIITRYRDRWLGLVLALFSATVATYSFANGMLIWFVVLGLIVFSKDSKRTSFVLIWLSVALIVFLSYIYNYEKPAHHPSLLSFIDNPLNFFAFFFSYIGAPFGNFFGLTGAICFGILGLCTLFFVIVKAYIYRQRDFFFKSTPWFGLILYILLSAVVTGIGRSGFSVFQALYSRYTTFSLIFWISLILIILLHLQAFGRQIRPSKPALLALAFFCLSLIISHSLSYAQGVIAFKKHFSRLSRIHSLLKYERFYGIDGKFATLFPSTPELHNAVGTLRELKMGPFYKGFKKPSGIYIQGAYFKTAGTKGAHPFSKGGILILDKDTQVSMNVDIPEAADHEFSAELEFAPDHGSILIMIDELAIGKTDCRIFNAKKNYSILKWINYGNIFLSKGVHIITIKSINAPNMLNAIAIKDSN